MRGHCRRGQRKLAQLPGLVWSRRGDYSFKSLYSHSEFAGTTSKPFSSQPTVDFMIENDFQISSVQPMEPPSGSDADEWHSYVIVQGDNTIRGCREGDLKAVTKAAEVIVAQLNERRMGKRARAQLVIAKTKKT